MIQYSKYRPTSFDSPGLNLDERQDWFVLMCVGRNRDSDCLSESNFAAALEILGGEGDDVEVHRFGHWACGWFEIILVKPGSLAIERAEEIEDRLDGYPVLDEADFSEREMEAANQVWRDCYSVEDRIRYIRRKRSDFEFHDFRDLMSCVRGRYFAGSASELLA